LAGAVGGAVVDDDAFQTGVGLGGHGGNGGLDIGALVEVADDSGHGWQPGSRACTTCASIRRVEGFRKHRRLLLCAAAGAQRPLTASRIIPAAAEGACLWRAG